jgi:hypothetical protein
MRKTYLATLIALALFSRISCAFFTGGSWETQFSGCSSQNPDKKETSKFLHQLKLNIEGHPTAKIETYGTIGNLWMASKGQYNVWTHVLRVGFRIRHSPNLTFGIGTLDINYSPYTIHLEEWQDNIFSGAFIESKGRNWDLSGFVGNHCEDKRTRVFKGYEVKPDIGYIYKFQFRNVETGHPTLWAGVKFNYELSDWTSLSSIYIHENYLFDREGYGCYIFNNNIIENIVRFKPLKFMNFSLDYALCEKNYSAYSGYWDYYGMGKHDLFLDYRKTEYANAYEVNAEIVVPKTKSSINGIYRNIGKDYTPLHMDNGDWDEERGENIFDNVYPDSKGWIGILKQTIYKKHRWTCEYWSFEDQCKSKKTVEWRFIVEQGIADWLDIACMYRSKKATIGFIRDDYDSIGGLFISLTAGLKGKVKGEIQFTQNKYDYRDCDEFLCKIFVPF